MPSNITCYVTLHILRDFVDEVELDPTRRGRGLSLQLRLSLNIPEKDIQSGDVEQQDILTVVRSFAEPGKSDTYQPNGFI